MHDEIASCFCAGHAKEYSHSDGSLAFDYKVSAAANAISHGLRTLRILPCRKSCFYKEICWLYEDFYINNSMTPLKSCFKETLLYLDTLNQFNLAEYKHVDQNLISQYAIINVLSNRSNLFIALKPEENYWALEYHQRLQSKSVKLLQQIQMYGKGVNTNGTKNTN
jgi:hypothetical protein